MCSEACTGPTTRQDRGRLRRNAHPSETKFAADPQHKPRNSWMQVHMLVRIRVMQCQSSCCEGRELRADLCDQLSANARLGEIADAQAKLLRREPTVCIDE